MNPSFWTYYGLPLIFVILDIIALWFMFKKAGVSGWKAIIPFYSQYIQFKLFWKTNFFWILLLLGVATGLLTGFTYSVYPDSFSYYLIGALISLGGIVVAIIQIIFYHHMAMAYGHGWPYTIGLVILNPIFLMILGFGGSRYLGNPSFR